MPIGILIDIAAVVLGGILGPSLGSKMSERIKSSIKVVLGLICFMLAIMSLIKVSNMGAVALSVILAFLVGLALDFNGLLKRGVNAICKRIFANSKSLDLEQFSIYVILFAFSATGILGAIQESLSGDSQLLLCKAILDFVTALIISAEIGRVTSLAAILQALVFGFCYFLASSISPYIQGAVYGDFSAAGGILLLMVALNMLKCLKDNAYPFNGILAFVFVVPISHLWMKVF